MVNAWWVNQGRSSKLGHGYAVVWAPLRSDSGRTVSSWDRMDSARPGDVVLHYANGAIRGFSVVVAPARAKHRPYDGGTWNNEGRVLDVEYAPMDVPIPLNQVPLNARLNEPTPHAAFTSAGRVNQGYFYPLTFELAQATLASAGVDVRVDETDDEQRLLFNGVSDRLGIARVRVEQPALRRRLLEGRVEAPCGLCGDTLPVEYLVAAHIKRRADCTERERADPDVAMLACLFGCDAAFERGHLRVKDNGSMTLHGPAPIPDRLARLEGQTASVFTLRKRRYFNAHRSAHASIGAGASGHPR